MSGSPINGDADELSADAPRQAEERPHDQHAVISTFDLFSIGVGPSSSHTVGPMRAARIFINDIKELGLLDQVHNVKITLYGSLAATGKGHHTPQAILLGMEGSDPESINTGTIGPRYDAIRELKVLTLGGVQRVNFDMDRDMLWRWDRVLKTHPNGMRFAVFDKNGDLLATNEYFSVGGGFVVNEQTKVDENLFYKGIDKRAVDPARLLQLDAPPTADPAHTGTPPSQQGPVGPPFPFHSGASLLSLTKQHNMTIAQLVYDNELSYNQTEEEIHDKLMRIWAVMDECIRSGVSSGEAHLPGRLRLRRRAPALYRRLMRGFYPGVNAPLAAGPALPSPSSAEGALSGPDGPGGAFSTLMSVEDNTGPSTLTNGKDAESTVTKTRIRPARVVGSFDHSILPMPPRKTTLASVDFLSCYAIAVNEVNASGGRIVTSPTNGAAGVIPAVLKYILEFISEDHEKSIITFLLTASAVGMLFKRGSTISAAEGGCQAEVGVACSMASAGFAACMGASPEIVLQAAEIGIEHNLGLTCDPIDGLVQVPCIERNSLGAVKAITAGQLALASDGVYSVSLDEAIEAMRLTAADMSVKYKETSLSGLATSVKIPLTSPAC
ncbi:serine dehydratase alpha chain-domain-containing protein [Auriculariales sp. MPI-PUGE-AT-0066]|nr:serine dehydratase alpha chain-domain-containing protein [Auriculariales sp. MPI-PUGE-AT-0066]